MRPGNGLDAQVQPTGRDTENGSATDAGPASMDIADAFATEPPPMDFVLPGMLAGTVGAIVSPGGAGKSMFALQLGVLVTSGADLAGLNEKLLKGRVLILAAEDPEVALRHRVHALGRHLSEEQRAEARIGLDIRALLGRGLDVMNDGAFEWLVERARGMRLIVLDTLRRVHQLDENSSSEMAELLSRLERLARLTGCTIVFLHHASKAAALGGVGDAQQAARGSSVLTDNIRWQSFLSTMSTKESEDYSVPAERRNRYVRWGVSKQNYGRPVSEVWLERKDGGILVPAEIQRSKDGMGRLKRTSRDRA